MEMSLSQDYYGDYTPPEGPSSKPLMWVGGVSGAVTRAATFGSAGYFLMSGISSMVVGPGVIETVLSIGTGVGWSVAGVGLGGTGGAVAGGAASSVIDSKLQEDSTQGTSTTAHSRE